MAEFNPFGLIGTQELDQQRVARRQKEADVRRAQLTGVDFASAELGTALGGALRKALGQQGLIKDREAEDAKAVDQAVSRANTAFTSVPSEIAPKDPFEAGILRRQLLIQELEGAGLSSQADTVRTQLVSLAEQHQKFLKSQGETKKLSVETKRAQEELKATQKGLREKDELLRLQAAFSQLDPTDPIQAARMDQISDRIDKITTITGSTEFDSLNSDKVTVRKVEQSLIENQGALDGFEASFRSFNPEFLTLKGKVKNFALRMADIAGLDLSDELKDELRDFTAFKQNTSINLNAYIKAVTGAQMSNPEAVRLKQDVPNLEDSPAEYQRKLEITLRRLRGFQQRGIEALNHVDNRKEFIKVLTTDAQEFIPAEPVQDVTEDEEQAALDALARLEGL